MRMLIFFDLPTETLEEKKEYRKFRKFLIKEGFFMVQYSVYSKLVLNATMAEIVKAKIYKNKPNKGIVQLLNITEKQYNSMEFIIGENHSNVIDSDKGVIIL